MKLYGYARVSSEDQDLTVQVEALKAAGCDVIRAEKASGASIDGRRELQVLLDFVRPGDAIVVTKLDRLARNTLDMLTLVTKIGEKGAGFRSIAEPWADTTTPAGELILTVFAGVATFERKRARERQAEGIALAKAEGRYKGGKQKFDPAEIRRLRAGGLGPAAIARQLQCSEQTVFRALNPAEETPA